MKNRGSRSADWEAYQQSISAPETLWSAVRANDVSELERLLAANADINARDYRGYSPLMLAAYLAHQEVFELLLARGADPNTTDFAGNTAVMIAAFMGNRTMVSRLLERGADLDAKTASGEDVISTARRLGREDVVQLVEDLRSRP